MNKAIFLSLLLTVALLQDPTQRDREEMVRRQIARRGVTDTRVLNAMRTVPRHLFVPSSWISDAYDDRPLPIGCGQTISQPYIVAYMTELIDPKPHHKVLEIGTGSGYQAAILSRIVDSVFSIEIVGELKEEAEHRLRQFGYDNVYVKHADGYYGWSEHAPFDAIIVTAAAEYVPPPLIRQLRDGGKMVIPVGSPFLVQTLVLVEKHGSEIISRNLISVMFVPLTRTH